MDDIFSLCEVPCPQRGKLVGTQVTGEFMFIFRNEVITGQSITLKPFASPLPRGNDSVWYILPDYFPGFRCVSIVFHFMCVCVRGKVAPSGLDGRVHCDPVFTEQGTLGILLCSDVQTQVTFSKPLPGKPQLDSSAFYLTVVI